MLHHHKFCAVAAGRGWPLVAIVIGLLASTPAAGLLAQPISAPTSKPAQTDSIARKFQDLWIPPTLEGKTFDLSLSKSSKSFWPGATTNTFGFNQSQFWGPTLILNQGDTVRMNVRNSLDEPTTTHWHGIHLPAAADGGPHQLNAPGKSWTTEFVVRNNAGTYWYHPHPHESTQKQITYGAGGLIIIRDPVESKLALPRTYGVDDIPLVLTSRRFLKNDQFSFNGDADKYGDFELVNGTLDPLVKLPRQFVRLRILNAEIERGYNLGFRDNRKFYLIATDGGLVDKPIPLTRLKLMVGERVEILVDLGSDTVGANVDLMTYNANQPFGFPGGEPGTTPPNGGYLNNRDYRVLRIQVSEPTAKPITTIPETLTTNHLWTDADVTNRRTINIGRFGPPEREFAFDKKYYDPHVVDHVVKLGAVESWTIVNDRTFGHSFHIHDAQFAIVSRTGGAVEEYEKGWKDSLYVPRGQSVTFVAKFDDFASDTDAFMYHCHMANHEDGGLMGQFLVSKDPDAIPKDAKGLIRLKERIEHPLTPTQVRTADAQSQTPAPLFKSADVSGKPMSLASLAETKPLLLFFIEKDCPCSRDAAPYFNRLQAAFGDACTVIGVINADAETAKAWAKQTGSQLPLIPDADLSIIRAYGAKGSVYSTLVAPGGTIVKTYPGYNAQTLNETAASIAKMAGGTKAGFSAEGAPTAIVSGCSFGSK